MRSRARHLCVALLLALAALAGAQTPRLGRLTFPTSERGEAQQAFVTGVLYLHSFEYESAAQWFRTAEALSPRFVMAYWGEAMTFTHPVWNEQDTAAARAALRKLAPSRTARLALAPTRRERAWLDAVETLYAEGSKASRDTAYERAMDRLSASYPDDESKLFHALALLGLNQGVRDERTYQRAGAIARDVLARNPEHPGAAHYVIHAYDDPAHAALGLQAARAYSGIAPDAPHAQHMTSHIFLALGMWDETVHANEVATTAVANPSEHHARSACGHYGEWLQYGYLQQGRPGEAARVLEECGALAAATPASVGRRLSLATERAVQIIETRDWNGAAARMTVDTVHLPAWGRGMLAYGTGVAALMRGDTVTGRTARDALVVASAHGLPEDRGRWEILVREVDALLALRTDRGDDALVSLRRAVAVDDSLPVDFGPPGTIKPPGELLGETLLASGRARDAGDVLQHQLARTPRRALTLLDLARAAAAAGDTTRAAQAYATLAGVWHEAEPTIPELAEVRRAGSVTH